MIHWSVITKLDIFICKFFVERITQRSYPAIYKLTIIFNKFMAVNSDISIKIIIDILTSMSNRSLHLYTYIEHDNNCTADHLMMKLSKIEMLTLKNFLRTTYQYSVLIVS